MKTIAYLGPEKTNTHVAARKKFGARARYLHAPTVDEVFHLVERRKADFGVVPIENSLEGAVTHTLDRFIDFRDSPVVIQGELEQPIRHCLILPRGVSLSQIRTVYSHPQALAQCHRWLAGHLSWAEQRETSSTADAVRHVAPGRSGVQAAIARREAAPSRLTALPISEARENKTRFLVLGLEEPRRGARNKTSILFSLKDRPGALYDALVPFKRERINLTKIESRPSKQKAWEYYFFIDVEGHESEPRLQRALAGLKRPALFMRVLGSYPSGRR